MKSKRTLKEKCMCFIGRPYLLNVNTAEVHDLRQKSKNCHLFLMARKNKRYLTETEFTSALKFGFKGLNVNGCRWCLKKHDTGYKYETAGIKCEILSADHK